MAFHVANDCTVYVQDILDLSPETNGWNTTVLLIPLRLGGRHFNTAYSHHIKNLLSLTYCLGIIGGKPKHSLYFIGFQDDHLICLDPHYCQPSVPLDKFAVDSYHSCIARKVSISSIDPSCTIGFVFKQREEFDDFCQQVRTLARDAQRNGEYPMFSLNETGRQVDDRLSMFASCGGGGSSGGNEEQQPVDRLLKIHYKYVDQNGRVDRIVKGDEFVLL